MSKSVYDRNEEARLKYNTLNNTYEDFCVGQRVKVICVGQDHYFFYDAPTGIVTKNSGRYLGITVKFDKPRHFKDGYIQTEFNFKPDDLIKINEHCLAWQEATERAVKRIAELEREVIELRTALENLLDAVEQAVNNIDLENREVHSFASLQVLVNALVYHGRKKEGE